MVARALRHFFKRYAFCPQTVWPHRAVNHIVGYAHIVGSNVGEAKAVPTAQRRVPDLLTHLHRRRKVGGGGGAGGTLAPPPPPPHFGMCGG